MLKERAFGKKTNPESSEEAMCLAHKEKNPAQDSSRGRGGQRGRGRYFRGRRANNLKEKRQICTAYAAKEMDHMMPLHAKYLGTKLRRKEINPKVKLMT